MSLAIASEMRAASQDSDETGFRADVHADHGTLRYEKGIKLHTRGARWQNWLTAVRPCKKETSGDDKLRAVQRKLTGIAMP